MSDDWVEVLHGGAGVPAAAEVVTRLGAEGIQARTDGERVLVAAGDATDAEALLAEPDGEISREEEAALRLRCTASVTEGPMTALFADELQRTLSMHGVESYADTGGLAGLIEFDAFPEARVRVAPGDLARAREIANPGPVRPSRTSGGSTWKLLVVVVVAVNIAVLALLAIVAWRS